MGLKSHLRSRGNDIASRVTGGRQGRQQLYIKPTGFLIVIFFSEIVYLDKTYERRECFQSCPSVWLFKLKLGSSHVAITYDTLDLSIQPAPHHQAPSPLIRHRHGTSLCGTVRRFSKLVYFRSSKSPSHGALCLW